MTDKDLIKYHGILDRITTISTIILLIFFGIIYVFKLAYPSMLFRVLAFSIFGLLIGAILSIVGKIIINIIFFKRKRDKNKNN
ncbi:MAG: hypothetical protein Q4E36_06475 [Bacillota bacterium]|nr:hypothetical protein [Bacillota bacterium]